MEGYDFFGDDDDDDAQTTTEDTTNWDVERWSLGEHQEDPNLDWDVLDDEVEYLAEQAPGLSDALSEAKEITETFNVGGFECAVCGLNHSHSDSKHDIRDIFNVTEEFAEQMKFSPFCHCGVSELARLVMYFSDVKGIAMFEDQHEFEAVLELRSEVVQNVYRTMNEVTAEDAEADTRMENMPGDPNRKLTFEEAIVYEEFKNQNIVPVDVRSELEDFYKRVDDIRNAARSAPIPSETEQSLNENLGEL